MNFGGYQLLSQIGTGPDGVAYRAMSPDGVTPVEVRDLSAARADALRWPEVDRRVRLARQLEHPCARRLIDPGFAHAAPFLILEWVEGPTLSEFFGDSLPATPEQALALTHEIVGALAAAHRVGLAHGRLGPDRVTRAEGGRPVLDFTGVDVCGPAPKTSPDRESDISALGGLLVWLLTGSLSLPESVAPERLLPDKPGELLRAMLAADPADRPSAREVEEALAGPLSATVAMASKAGPGYEEITSLYLGPSASSLPTLSGPTVPMLAVGGVGVGQTLGRYVLRDVLGVGGQGVVYRAEDSADGTTVAVKVLRPEWVKNFDAARRFRKEARMLATVNNPFVVNLLEHNEDGGVPYLVMEFVTGPTLSGYLADHGRMDEPTALTVAADIARALEDAHGRGIIHRDIKPSNVMVLDAPGASSASSHPRVKLTDFGLARPLVEQESLALTATGAVLGTPQYMAPEQSAGRPVNARTDIYALGATLFHMLSGRPPFLADTRERLNAMHHTEKPLSSLKGLKVELSEGVCRALERALAKSPDDRYPDATAFRRDLERLARGEPTGIPLHPILPTSDPKRALNFEFRWDLEATPRQLWPHVTNTDRLDRALGFPPLRYSYHPDPDVGVRVFAEGMKAGMAEAWEERPYEWVEPRRMGVLREYSRGPFHWLVSTVELNPRPGGGTTLVHRLRLEPRGWKARAFSPLGVGVRFRAALGRIYERIDATLAGKLGPPTAVDPFEPVAEMAGPARERLDSRLDALASAGVTPDAVEWLGDLLARGPVQELARLRPLALARRWGLEPDAVLNACLHAAREGLLVLLWDILCPSCRLSCEIGDTLKAIREHGHCDACQLDFTLDFANSVELIFRVHPEIRAADTGHYCAGGPAHAPHVLAQVRVAPGERFELEMTLPEGDYRLRGPQLPWLARFQVRPSARARRVDVDLVSGPVAGRAWSLAPGGQVLALLNPGGHELLARVERETARDDALTAARALTSAPFRALFPGEVLSPGQLVSVTAVTLLVTDLDRPGRVYEELGEARAFEVIHEHFRLLGESIVRAGGTLVKTVDDGVVASFPSPEDAVSVALDLPGLLHGQATTRGLRLRVGVHRGPAMVATLDGRLDYFGPAARRARRLLRHARGGELVLTPEVANDPRVFALARERGRTSSVFDAGLDGPLHRLEANEP